MSLLLGYIGTIIGYLIILTIIYHFVYSREGGILSKFFLFFCTYAVGVLICSLYYRISVLGNTPNASISSEQTQTIMMATISSYMIVAITIFAIGFNKGLVEIFENTLGYLYIQIFGANQFANELFSSTKFDPIINDTSSSDFNYGFLLTRFTSRNIQEFINSLTNDKTEGNALMLDFKLNPNRTQEQIDQLAEFVYTKHKIGHFAWVYFTSIIALTISLVAVGM